MLQAQYEEKNNSGTNTFITRKDTHIVQQFSNICLSSAVCTNNQTLTEMGGLSISFLKVADRNQQESFTFL